LHGYSVGASASLFISLILNAGKYLISCLSAGMRADTCGVVNCGHEVASSTVGYFAII